MIQKSHSWAYPEKTLIWKDTCTPMFMSLFTIAKIWKQTKCPNIFSEILKWHEVAQLCRTLCNPTDCNPPGSSIHGIFQAWILEWLPFPSPGDLPDPGMEPGSPTLQADAFTIWATREVPLNHKKEWMPFGTIWMDLKIIILSEGSQTEKKNIVRYHLYVECKIWYKWNYSQNRNRLTQNKLTVTTGKEGKG